jgi:type IV secretory pathway VirB3-like protein
MGRVFLIGAGPGDPELLTLKAARLLACADVVLHDSLVSGEVLARISPRAELIDVGKRCGRKLLTQDEINALLVSYAASHEVVVRLKGGDPSIFGRAGEELEALRKASVEFEVVPGVTAALGAAAAAGVCFRLFLAVWTRMRWIGAVLRLPQRWFSICPALITARSRGVSRKQVFRSICHASSFLQPRVRNSRFVGAASARFPLKKNCLLRR